VGGSAAAQEQRGLPAGDPPQPGAGRVLGLVARCARPGREEGLLQDVLYVGRRQHGAEPGGQDRCVPSEQLAQRPVVTARQARDQLVVIHYPSIAPGHRKVRE